MKVKALEMGFFVRSRTAYGGSGAIVCFVKFHELRWQSTKVTHLKSAVIRHGNDIVEQILDNASSDGHMRLDGYLVQV